MITKILKNYNKKKLNNDDFSFLFDEAKADEYVVFDTETTGLNPKVDEILSIGALKIKQNKILTSQKFEIFLKPIQEVKEQSIKIHRIRNEDVKNAIDAKEGILEFLHFIKSSVLVGYYIKFDIAMINKYAKKLLNIKLPNQSIEISDLYKKKLFFHDTSGLIDLKFDSILTKLDVPIIGKHDAINDALMSAIAFLKLKD